MNSSPWRMCLVGAMLAVVCSAHLSRRLRDPVTWENRSVLNLEAAESNDDPLVGWKTLYYAVPIDNFAFTSNATYQMKYLQNLTYYEAGGPIFFYTGNEGTIEGFARNTGIMFDLAKRFHAAIFFAEHRYYGTSMPFGNRSYEDVKYLGYLDSSQALADYAKLITYLKRDVLKCSDDTPLIAFGGSLGGMMSSWFRMKYPHLVTGAWAASAPLMYFKGGNTSPGAFEHVVKMDFLKAGCNEKTIMNGLEALRTLPKTPEGLAYVNDLFRIDPKLTQASDGAYLVSWLNTAMDYMAMVDYPYPSNFMNPMPGWPINYVCEHFVKEELNDPKQAAAALYQLSNVYFNFTGSEKTNCINYDLCGDQGMASLGSQLGWPWQTCTELDIQMCAQGPPNDFFDNDCKNYGGVEAMQLSYCKGTFSGIGWYPGFLNSDAVGQEYGFNFEASSNTIFTNGDVDPWSAAGVYENTAGIKAAMEHGVYTFLIAGGAHHLDLRQPNTCDPPTVRNARYQIVNIIDCWVHPTTCITPPKASPLPPLGSLVSKDCKPEVFAYPWGQGPLTTTTAATTTSASPKTLTSSALTTTTAATTTSASPKTVTSSALLAFMLPLLYNRM